MSLFSPNNTIKFITHTTIPLKRIAQELIGYPVQKTKLMGRVEVVQDKNKNTSVGDDVFQVSELVEPYRVAPSINFEENLNFHIFDNIFVDFDTEELNVILSSIRQAQINEDDDTIVINVEDCGGADDNSIEEEEDNSD